MCHWGGLGPPLLTRSLPARLRAALQVAELQRYEGLYKEARMRADRLELDMATMQVWCGRACTQASALVRARGQRGGCVWLPWCCAPADPPAGLQRLHSARLPPLLPCCST